jgi:hypothetical protein
MTPAARSIGTCLRAAQRTFVRSRRIADLQGFYPFIDMNVEAGGQVWGEAEPNALHLKGVETE